MKMPPLTDREISVLRQLANGRTTKEIAETLKLSSSTVASHRRSLCRKFNLHSTAELVAFAVQFKSTHSA